MLICFRDLYGVSIFRLADESPSGGLQKTTTRKSMLRIQWHEHTNGRAQVSKPDVVGSNPTPAFYLKLSAG